MRSGFLVLCFLGCLVALSAAAKAETQEDKLLAASFNAVDYKCPACKFITNYIKTLLTSNMTTEQVEEQVYQKCVAQFSSWLPTVCDDVKPLIGEVIGYLLSGESTDVVCRKLRLCPRAAALDIDLQCPACKFAVNYIQQLVQQGSTLDKIKVAVHDKCMQTFSGIMQLVCGFVDAKVDEMVQYVLSGDAIDVACKKLKMCNTKADDEVVQAPHHHHHDAHSSFTHVPAAKDDLQCPACKFAVNYVQQLVQQGSTLDKIKVAVHDKCTQTFSGIMQMVCGFVDAKVDEMVQYVLSGDAIDVACRKLKMCK